MSWLRAWWNPTAMTPTAPMDVSESDNELINTFAREIVRRRLEVPAVMFLEVNRPLSFFVSQGLHFFTPMLGLFASMEKIDKLATLLDSPEGYEQVIERIEELAREAKKVQRKKNSE